ncbi:hypothetical protein ACFZBP_02125 [Streptomyces sp. NPDC008086]|uniref:hypothetical protein n=1 Tax=Streptomyces sp. NPDC008086 TaxID=3364807 RepID=UPI0036E063FA
MPVLAVPSPRTASDDAPTETGPPFRAGSPRSSVDHVAHFYGAYIDALHDVGRGQLADALRLHYFTPALRRSLARWEANHHHDGVLRAQDVPSGRASCITTAAWDTAGAWSR